MISLEAEWKPDSRGEKFNPAKRVTKVGGEGEEKGSSFTIIRGQSARPSTLLHLNSIVSSLGAELETVTKGTNPSAFGNWLTLEDEKERLVYQR